MQMPDNMGPEFTERFKKLFPQIAKDTKSRLIPFLIAGVGGNENLNQPDGYSPNYRRAKNCRGKRLENPASRTHNERALRFCFLTKDYRCLFPFLKDYAVS